MDDGSQEIEDADILAQVRKQARKVYMESIIASALLAIIFAVIPV